MIKIHDILVIGAGPCGLAVCARLREQTPSAVFTEEEHRRYHWIAKHRNQTSLKHKNGNVLQACSIKDCGRSVEDILVLDAAGDDWLCQWKRLFKTFDISHLRSPMFFHVDPADRDGLLEYAYHNKREGELKEICNCVGRELSKHERKARVQRKRNHHVKAELAIDERDRKDYFCPSTDVFSHHCDQVINRYDLSNIKIQKESVEHIDYDFIKESNSDEKLFTIRTNTGTHFARTVVMAIGSGHASVTASPQTPHPSHHDFISIPNSTHSHSITTFPSLNIQHKLSKSLPTTVLIIGGGLTSAQLVDLSLRRGVTKVHLLLRSQMKTKPFDIDLTWMGKFKNHEKATFFSADTDQERLSMIQSARKGGSITAPYAKLLQQYEKAGRLVIHTNTVLSSHRYDSETVTTTISTCPYVKEMEKVEFDHIYFATGMPISIDTLPFMKTLMDKYPIDVCGEMPCLTHELAWKEDVPFFVTGRLAGLRVGPGAGNLEGARNGAERIAWGLEDWVSKNKAEKEQRFDWEQGEVSEVDKVSSDGRNLERYIFGIGSMFASLKAH